MKMLASLPAMVAGLFLSSGASAEEFLTVRDQGTFLDVVEGRKLTRLGIELDVMSNGQITGKAFGVPVSGAWRWQDGFFCRDLYYGERDLGPNCQVVKVNGDTVRFIADQGSGQSADLRLR